MFENQQINSKLQGTSDGERHTDEVSVLASQDTQAVEKVYEAPENPYRYVRGFETYNPRVDTF